MGTTATVIRTKVATPARLERATPCLEGRCSIRLSYGVPKDASGAAGEEEMGWMTGFEPATT